MAYDEKTSLPKPAVTIVVDGNVIAKPGMKVYFVDDAEKGHVYSTDGNIIVFERECTCNKVATSTSKSTRKSTSKSTNTGGGTTVCTCNKICTCNKVT